MLAPNDRAIYVEALTPPVGFELTEAIATTYSADLETLVGIPIHLAIQDYGIPEDLDASTLQILLAFRRLAKRLTIFVHGGCIAAPTRPHRLFAQIEPVLVEASGPQGALHAKLWVLRFERAGEVRLRMIVPTRNLTTSRAWDAALVLDGLVTRSPDRRNRPIADLLNQLPALARGSVSDAVRERCARLAEDVRRTVWEAPPGWDLVGFEVLGLARTRSLPFEDSDELVIVSPFVVNEAIRGLLETTKKGRALIARPEELAKLQPDLRTRFEDCYVLADDASSDPDGEELDAKLRGLHAKLYFAQKGATTNLWIGSANATRAGLYGHNLEILAQLSTRKSKPIEELLSERGIADLLEPFDPKVAPEVETELAARLEVARQALVDAPLSLHARADGSAWHLEVETASPIVLEPGVSLRAWPVTLDRSLAVDASELAPGRSVALARGDQADLTSLVGFELGSDGEYVRFVRNLPIDGVPETRES
jgi:hypothetical protein